MWLRIIVLAGCVFPAAIAIGEDRLDFNQDIRPLLSDRCFSCHGPDAAHREADLRLDDETSAKEYAIEPGSAEDSLIIQRILSTDADMVMPPPETGKPLSDDEKAKLQRWVDEGAIYAPHWAYVAPTKHSVPYIDPVNATANWIDPFILEKLNTLHLPPTERAAPSDLLRRLAYDLTGLPPSAEMVESFKADHSETAYCRMVDRLLCSPRFGERIASVWFDLVRYADTVGYHGDQDHNLAPYRDWVIDAFNSNMPFDQFTREQLAGDLLPDATIDQKIASGYNRLLQTTHEGGLQPKEYLAIYAADRVRNVSAVWMGATLGCAQCHDHKYDPYTAEDFYSMAAFFADLDEQRHFKEGKNALPTNRPPEIDVLRPIQRIELNKIDQQISTLKHQQETLEGSTEQSSSDVNVTEQLSKIKQTIARLSKRREDIQALARRTMISVSIEPREIRVLPRGNWLDDTGAVVQSSVPKFLESSISSEERATRLDLANWLTDTESGYGAFTARVMVNRIWAMLFGSGLSRSVEDFGGQGEPPSHPELLDRLAIDFYESGWDTKHIIRQIVLSEAYRRSSEISQEQLTIDPTNRWLARQNRFRLPAEMIRDQALLLGNLLVLEEGGQSSRPYQPVDYYRHLNFPQRKYQHDMDRNQYRRGVYVHWQRQFLHPMLRAFDAPNREECTAKRATSNTPLASLALMNDPTFVEAARGFALQIISSRKLVDDASDHDRSTLTFAFQTALGRAPETYELDVLLESLQSVRETFEAEPKLAEQYLKVGMLDVDDRVDLSQQATWTEIARTILNLNELIVRP